MNTPTTTPAAAVVDRFRPHLPYVITAAVVLVLGLFEVGAFGYGWGFYGFVQPLIVIAFAAAIALSRFQPGIALGIVWVVAAMQLIGGVQVLFVQAAVVVVAFACARWGSRVILWTSLASIPLAIVLVGLAGQGPFGGIVDFLGFNGIIDVALNAGLPWRILLGAVALAVVAVPWLIGFALRLNARARSSEASTVEAREEVARVTLEAQQAAEIARLQEERSQLALDVHDVVGHSLAVILAQAESAQFLPDDPAKLKATIATIATSARGSLQDVRHVLGGSGPGPRPLEVDVLLESARAAGFTVTDEESGEPHPLPPEVQTVAHRVLQEMITNAIRHGSRTSPIRVARRWPAAGAADEGLQIEVSNATEGVVEVEREGAQGVVGMRRRLLSVGGSLEVRPPARKGGRFTALATIPVRRRAVADA